jgi:hypothetical protein
MSGGPEGADIRGASSADRSLPTLLQIAVNKYDWRRRLMLMPRCLREQRVHLEITLSRSIDQWAEGLNKVLIRSREQRVRGMREGSLVEASWLEEIWLPVTAPTSSDQITIQVRSAFVKRVSATGTGPPSIGPFHF